MIRVEQSWLSTDNGVVGGSSPSKVARLCSSVGRALTPILNIYPGHLNLSRGSKEIGYHSVCYRFKSDPIGSSDSVRLSLGSSMVEQLTAARLADLITYPRHQFRYGSIVGGLTLEMLRPIGTHLSVSFFKGAPGRR